jgi:PPOX class probable F420-dependent enzyme
MIATRMVEMALDEDTIRLAKGKNLASVVTLMPDGQPQALLTWIDTDGEHLLVNTEPTRQRARNLARDPRITVLIHSADDPWDWSEVRGHVVQTVDGQPARDHIDELSRKYLGTEYRNPIGPRGRIIFKIAPDRVNTPALLSR